MDRLTEKHYLGTDHYIKCSENCHVDMDCIDCPSFDRLVERLAAYEDSGCAPEEVLPRDKADEIALKLMRLADLESLCSYDRLRELAEADKDERVVVHGGWIPSESDFDDDDTLFDVEEWCDWQCSACREDICYDDPMPLRVLPKYCPNCGAKMDGGDSDAAD